MKINNDYSFLNTTNYPEIIQDQIKKMVSIIRKGFKDYGLLSIMLSGSAAKGELALIKEGDKYIPFGDYDYYTVTKRKVPYKIIYEVKKEINNTVFGGTDPERGFLIDIECKCLKQKVRFNCDLASYDFLETYKLLYGDDIYNGIKISIKDIPLISVFRILLNRMSHLAMAYTSDFKKRKPNSFEYADIRKTMLKTYLEIGGVLTFLHGEYSPYFKKRLEILSKICDQYSWLIDLSGIIDKIKKATFEKLNPEKKQYYDVFKERKFIAQHSLHFAKIIASKFSSKVTEESSHEILCNFLYKELPYLYYSHYIKYEIKQRFKINLSNSICSILSILANIVEYKSFQKKTEHKFLKKGNWRSPIILYYFCTIWLLIATCLEKVEDRSKNKALMKINNVLFNNNSSIRCWEDVRNISKNIWYSYKGGKIR